MSSYSNPYGYAYATSGSVPYGLGDPYPSPTANYDSRVMTRDYSHARSESCSSSGSAAAPQQKQLKARQASSSSSNQPPQYPCLYPGCSHVSGRSFDLERHMKKHNPVPAEKKIDCPGKGCGRVGKHGFDRKDHMKEHLVNHHHRDIREVKGKDDPTPTRRSGRDGERY